MTHPSTSTRLALAIFVGVACLLTTAPAHADGKFFRPQSVATDPNIPAQRAILAWKDGRETLVLESVVDGSGDSFGWVVPLPAEPDQLRTCGAGIFPTLAQVIKPEVGRGPGEIAPISVLFLVAVCFACVSSILSGDRTRARTGRAVSFLAILFIGLLIGYLCVPTLMDVRGVPGVAMLSTTRAGPYEVTVIRGESGDAVSQWLATNGFTASPEAASVFADYAARKWCFAAAKIVREGAQPISPVPLLLAFPSAKPIYPMRLTGVGLSKLQLDLYVIAAQRPVAHGLNVWLSDTFDHCPPRSDPGAPFEKAGPEFIGQSTRAGIGHPDVTALMWPGCVLTHLHGSLRSPDLYGDIHIEWREPEAHRAKVYSASVAWSYAGIPAVWIIGIGLSVATWINIKRGWTLERLSRRILLPALLLALATACAVRGALTVVPTQRDYRGMFASIRWDAHRTAIKSLTRESPLVEFPLAYEGVLPKHDYDAPGEVDLNIQDVPGGYRIDPAEGGGWTLTVFDSAATPWIVRMDHDGRPVYPSQ